ncbi:nucleolin-like [Octopus sinensis]|uniref:Nucleolin-like n=1 Tax=Octopus sinensis TaxID=2607531 RepID=A0A6P7TY34_9MOLL|nr:nucleolin-like [Octopus sinensis]
MDVSEEEEAPPVQPPKKQKSQPQKVEKMKVASPVSKQASQPVKKPEMGEKGTKRKRDEETVPMSAEEFTVQNDQKRLFVTNLPGNVTEDEIKSLDKNIVDFVILAAYRKRKWYVVSIIRSSVILVFPSEAVVERVFPLLQGKDVRGNKLVVDYVGHKNSKRNPQDSIPWLCSSVGPIVDNRLYVGNLGEHCNEASLKAIFTTATKISVPVKRRHKLIVLITEFSFGFVEFADFPAALEALKKHNYSVFKGEKMIVQFARAKTEESKSKEDSSSKRVKVEESESEGIDEESGEDIGDSEDDDEELDDESGDDLESFDEEEED